MPCFYKSTAKVQFLRSTANASIDSETLPDPGVVAGLEAIKLLSDPHFFRLVVVMAVSFLDMWGSSWTRKRCADLRSGRWVTHVEEVGDEMTDGSLWVVVSDDLVSHDLWLTTASYKVQVW